MSQQPVLKDLLDEGGEFDPHYLPSYNSDHLPMALIAMSHLGASDESLVDYQRHYRKRLRPVQASPALASLEDGRGVPDAYASNRTFLLEEIAADGWQTVVRRHLPGLLASLPTGAFHPLIRLGAGISVGHQLEIVSALAYWMTSSFAPVLPAAVSGQSMAVTLGQDHLNHEPSRAIPPGPFSQGLREIAARGYPAPVDTSMQDCASAALDVYLGTRNFFALHLVTANQAARMCLPFVVESEMVASLSAGMRAAYQVLNAPDFTIPLPVPDKIDDEHGIKYVYACASEYSAWNDPRYLTEIEGFKREGLVPDWVRPEPEASV